MTRITELTSKLLDGALSATEGAELDALLASDPAAAAEYLALLNLEAELRGLRTNFDLSGATLLAIRAAQADRTAEAVLAEIADAPAPTWATRAVVPAPARERQPWRFVAGVAALAVAAALVALWLGGAFGPAQPGNTPQVKSPAAPPPVFARLAHKSGSVEVTGPGGDALPAEEGAELPAGFTVRTVGEDSAAIVELQHDKTRVEIEPDTVVRFADPGNGSRLHLFLAAGQLTAAVPLLAADRSLVVSTPVGEVTSRGGTFVVSSAGPDSARVDIKQGKVEVQRAVAPKPVPVFGGSAVVRADRVELEGALAVDRLPRRTLAFPGPRAAVFSPDGTEVWVASARAFTRWSVAGAPTEVSFYRRPPDGFAAFTPDRSFLLTYRDDNVLVRSLPDGGEQGSLNAKPNDPRFWAVAPKAAWVAVVDPRPNNRRVRVLDAAGERFAREFDDATVTCVAATPDGKQLAVATHTTVRGVGDKVVFLDADTSDRLFALSVLKRPVTAMAFSADGRYLAIGYNGVVQVWDMRAHELVRSISGFERVLTCLAFSADGTRLAAGTQDGHVWMWDTVTGRHTQLIDLGVRGVRSVSFSPDGKQLVAVANSPLVTVWEVTERPAAEID